MDAVSATDISTLASFLRHVCGEERDSKEQTRRPLYQEMSDGDAQSPMWTSAINEADNNRSNSGIKAF